MGSIVSTPDHKEYDWVSRTRKGSKGPGWEPWSNLREKQEQAADYSMHEWRNAVTIDKTKWRVTESEYLMGRESVAPIDSAMRVNMEKLLIALNLIRDLYGKPMKVSSGYRPSGINAATPNASKTSCHLTCEACDFEDTDRKLVQWCLRNMDILAKAGLYMESPINTPSWVHLQTRAPRSGKRVFLA